MLDGDIWRLLKNFIGKGSDNFWLNCEWINTSKLWQKKNTSTINFLQLNWAMWIHRNQAIEIYKNCYGHFAFFTRGLFFVTRQQFFRIFSRTNLEQCFEHLFYDTTSISIKNICIKFPFVIFILCSMLLYTLYRNEVNDSSCDWVMNIESLMQEFRDLWSLYKRKNIRSRRFK